MPVTLLRFSLMLGFCALTAGTAAAQKAGEFPSRPMRIITGYLPGGVSDTIARTMATQLGEQMGQRIIIDGRPGAGGTLAMEIAANASPDGYTLFMGQPVITISPNFKRRPSYDPIKAFAPLSVIGLGATMMMSNPSIPANNVQELVAYGKTQPPGKLMFGHSGQGSTNHLAGELFSVMSGVQLTAVAYKGAAANILATVQGEVQLSFLPVLAALPQIKIGKLRAIGVTGSKRAKSAPQVPTIAETLPGYEVPVWYGLMAPAATPKSIVGKLNLEIKKALSVTAVVDRLESQGIETEYTTVAEFEKLIREDAVRWANLVKTSGIVLE
ncbi:MAG: tripartite tricarboxylate transporter substrate binding protein [Burkholderiales bacterium]|nr:tripartite tricarboxylate transporter substrate binding protein [Burkholderiales bacterium]MCW5603509.1 tripartite tricarboxylate transporter substrate binding protein [Burkholderiales bacterium]